MGNVIFVSDFKGYKLMCPADPIELDGRKYKDGEVIVQFQPYKAVGIRGVIEKGHLILNSDKDAHKIDYLKKFSRVNIDYREVRSLPTETMENNSVVSGGAIQTSNELSASQISKISIQKTLIMKDLERKLFKEENGELVLKAKIDEAELNQYSELKKELGL